jgi:hypothetical protein
MALRLLVVDESTPADRESYRAALGKIASQSYAATLTKLAPSNCLYQPSGSADRHWEC